MQQTTNSDLSRHYLPRQLRHLILQEYLSGVKTARQLSEEHGIPMSTIHKLGQRWKAKNSCSFVSTPNPYPIMSRVTSEEASELLSENKALRRRLEAELRTGKLKHHWGRKTVVRKAYVNLYQDNIF